MGGGSQKRDLGKQEGANAQALGPTEQKKFQKPGDGGFDDKRVTGWSSRKKEGQKRSEKKTIVNGHAHHHLKTEQ